MAARLAPWAAVLLAGGFALTGSGPAAASAAAPSGAAIEGSYLLAGGGAAWLFEPGRGSRSFVAEALFHPDAVGQFSARLARLRLGLCLRYTRSLVVDRLDSQGAEVAVRRGLGREGLRLAPFVELGLGQYRVDDRRQAGARSTWSAVLGLGAERSLGGRWLIAGAVQLRSLEFAEEGLSHAGFTLTLGGRIDS